MSDMIILIGHFTLLIVHRNMFLGSCQERGLDQNPDTLLFTPK